ncbi:MAG: hypothetical protein ACN4G0_03595, partial [Polyangiales bacterium]
LEENRRTKWLIIESSQGLVAIVVDAVRDVFASSSNERRQVPVLDERHLQRGIESAFHHDDGLVFLLNADRLAEPALDISPQELAFLPLEAP